MADAQRPLPHRPLHARPAVPDSNNQKISDIWQKHDAMANKLEAQQKVIGELQALTKMMGHAAAFLWAAAETTDDAKRKSR